MFSKNYLEEQELYIPKKKSFRKNIHKINPNCLKQNSLRSKLKKILPNTMKYVEDNIYGIDFEYNGITIDQKFCFGDLGNNVIKIRVKNRRLINKSDYTMCINENEDILIFKTSQLSQFVNKNWGIIQKNRIEEKKNYVTHKVNLNDFYRINKTILHKTIFNKDEFKYTLDEIIATNNKKEDINFKNNNFTNLINEKLKNTYKNVL